MIRLFLMFLVGLLTWGLTFGRSLSFRSQHLGWLSSIIFFDEITGICIGMFLARHGTLLDAVACAFGGTVSAMIVMRSLRWRNQSKVKED